MPRITQAESMTAAATIHGASQGLLMATLIVAASLTGAHPAFAQQQGAAAAAAASQGAANSAGDRSRSTPNTLSLIDGGLSKKAVTADELYTGFRATHLLGQGVKGSKGEHIGEVQDILLDHEGKITAVVVEAGGFLDIGDAAFRVKWDELSTTPGRDGIEVPITKETAERYSLFDGPETLALNPREFRVSEIIGDAARLKDGVGYGRVSNLVFDRKGYMLGVLVTRDYSYGAGLYGYPYYGFGIGWSPTTSYYALPYSNAELAAKTSRLDAARFTEAEKRLF